MTILLYDDGRLVIDDGNPIEGRASLDGLVACVSDPQDGDTLKFDGNQWVAGAAASGLPAVSGDDNGKVLTVVEGEWAPAAAGGGGGVYVAEFLWSDDAFAYVSVDNADDVWDQLAAGKIIIFHVPASAYADEINIQPYGASYGGGYAWFWIVVVGNVTGCTVDNNKIVISIYEGD